MSPTQTCIVARGHRGRPHPAGSICARAASPHSRKSLAENALRVPSLDIELTYPAEPSSRAVPHQSLYLVSDADLGVQASRKGAGLLVSS